MLVRLALLVALALAGRPAPLTRQAPAAASEPLADPAVRARLRLATGEIAKTGEAELVERVRAVLLALGDTPEELARWQLDWDQQLRKQRPQRSVRTAAAKRLQRELEPLVVRLAKEPEPRRSALAAALVALDSELAEANALLGRERDADGVWSTRDEQVWKQGAGAAANLANTAASLPIDIEHGASTNPALAALGGGARLVRGEGVELHARLPAASLERILRQALRAGAFSRGLLFGRADLPSAPARFTFVLLDAAEQRLPAAEEALTNRGLSSDDHRQVLALDLHSFHDARGWRTAAWRSEADFEALILWDLVDSWLGRDAQPCLRMGHLNGVCLRFLGTSAPLVAWSETSVVEPDARARSSAVGDDPRRRQALWRVARQSLWGSRAWMLGEVRAGRDPPWARALVDQDGKIRDANLLKTTLVCELLQAEGRLWELVQGTRGKGPSVAALEAALGETLPQLEERWRRWIDPPQRTGVVQALLAPAAAAAREDPFAAALLALNQARADALLGQQPEIPLVVHDPELARAAEAHARYLTLNPDQKGRWPAMHEEFAGQPGFSPEGALAGGRALIAFEGDPRAAIDAFLATFYHRLPLLEPGLFGVGFGRSEEVVLLDARSLVLAPWKEHVVVWPLPEAQKVPRRFRPELPNPVPGEDMDSFGFPVSVQLSFVEEQQHVELALDLFQGHLEVGIPVPCYRISPDAPLERELVPPNAWGLIPKAPLAKQTRYTARARWSGQEKSWSFTTGD